VNVRTNGYWVLVGIWWCTCFLALRSTKLTGGYLVIYQQPRPGPKLPKGESYLTIGWKQVIYLTFLLTRTLFLVDWGCLETIQENPSHIHILIRLFPSLRCLCYSHHIRICQCEVDIFCQSRPGPEHDRYTGGHLSE